MRFATLFSIRETKVVMAEWNSKWHTHGFHQLQL